MSEKRTREGYTFDELARMAIAYIGVARHPAHYADGHVPSAWPWWHRGAYQLLAPAQCLDAVAEIVGKARELLAESDQAKPTEAA